MQAVAGYEAGGGSTRIDCTRIDDGSGAETFSIAIGNENSLACASNAETVAIRRKSWRTGSQSTVIGNDVIADSNAAQAVIIGSNFNANATTSSGRGGVAIGSGLTTGLDSPTANGIGSVAIGSSGNGSTNSLNGAAASGNHALALMAGAEALATNSIALGTAAIASEQGAVSVGGNALADSTGSVAVGESSLASGGTSVAVGQHATATGSQSIAIGGVAGSTTQAAEASGEQSIAIGANVISAGDSSVAIGGDDLNSASNTNVDGTEVDTSGSTGDARYNQGSVNTTFRDISGRDLVDTANQYPNTAASGAASVAVGVQAVSSGALSTAFGTQSNSGGVASAAFGVSANASQDGSVALGAGSSTLTNANSVTSATVNGTTYGNFAGSTDIIAGDQVSVGSADRERQIKHVAAGNISADSTDAINGSQLFSVATTLSDAQAVIYTDADGNELYKQPDGTFQDGAGTTVGNANVITSIRNADGTATTPTTLANVADGVNDNDAVNLSQSQSA